MALAGPKVRRSASARLRKGPEDDKPQTGKGPDDAAPGGPEPEGTPPEPPEARAADDASKILGGHGKEVAIAAAGLVAAYVLYRLVSGGGSGSGSTTGSDGGSTSGGGGGSTTTGGGGGSTTTGGGGGGGSTTAGGGGGSTTGGSGAARTTTTGGGGAQGHVGSTSPSYTAALAVAHTTPAQARKDVASGGASRLLANPRKPQNAANVVPGLAPQVRAISGAYGGSVKSKAHPSAPKAPKLVGFTTWTNSKRTETGGDILAKAEGLTSKPKAKTKPKAKAKAQVKKIPVGF